MRQDLSSLNLREELPENQEAVSKPEAQQLEEQGWWKYLVTLIVLTCLRLLNPLLSMKRKLEHFCLIGISAILGLPNLLARTSLIIANMIVGFIKQSVDLLKYEIINFGTEKPVANIEQLIEKEKKYKKSMENKKKHMNRQGIYGQILGIMVDRHISGSATRLKIMLGIKARQDRMKRQQLLKNLLEVQSEIMTGDIYQSLRVEWGIGY